MTSYVTRHHHWPVKLKPSPTFSISIHYFPPRGTPLYKPHMYVPPQRVEVLDCFGLKTGIDFAHLGMESDSFRGKEGDSVWTYVSFPY